MDKEQNRALAALWTLAATRRTETHKASPYGCVLFFGSPLDDETREALIWAPGARLTSDDLTLAFRVPDADLACVRGIADVREPQMDGRYLYASADHIDTYLVWGANIFGKGELVEMVYYREDAATVRQIRAKTYWLTRSRNS